MRAVKSTDTKPELAVRRLIYSLGYRYRLHDASLPGAPDLVFRGRRKAVFVNGCFWHGHRCRRGARVPKTNQAYWSGKIARNVARDARVARRLRSQGWGVLHIWECQLKRHATLARRILAFLGPRS